MNRFPSADLAGHIHSLFRIVVGFLFACHGAAALLGILMPAHGAQSAPVRFGAWPSWWAAVIELVGGTLVAVGLGTRIAAVICSGAMAYAYFVVHQRHGALPIQNGGELAALYSWLFLLIAIVGPGPFAVDTLLGRRRAERRIARRAPGGADEAAWREQLRAAGQPRSGGRRVRIAATPRGT